ncbi:Uncharacterised protein g165 [Pycnogonum litorale]
MDCKTHKRNTLCMIGKSNSGKSTLAKVITSCFSTGMISNTGAGSQFAWASTRPFPVPAVERSGCAEERSPEVPEEAPGNINQRDECQSISERLEEIDRRPVEICQARGHGHRFNGQILSKMRAERTKLQLNALNDGRMEGGIVKDILNQHFMAAVDDIID